GTDGVKQDIDGVVAGGIEAPESMLESERGEGERIVLRGGPQVEPDARETPRLGDRPVVGDVGIIIPNEAIPQGGHVGHEREAHDQQRSPGENAVGTGCIDTFSTERRARIAAPGTLVTPPGSMVRATSDR